MFLSDLKRFSDSKIRSSKLTTYVNFPLKELDLREFASENSGKCLQEMTIIHVFFKASWIWQVLTALSPSCRACCVQPVCSIQPLWKCTGRPLYSLLQKPSAGGVVQLQRLQVLTLTSSYYLSYHLYEIWRKLYGLLYCIYMYLPAVIENDPILAVVRCANLFAN